MRRSDPLDDVRGDNVFPGLVPVLPPRADGIKGGMLFSLKPVAGDIPGDKSGERGGRSALLPTPPTLVFDEFDRFAGRMLGPNPGGGE